MESDPHLKKFKDGEEDKEAEQTIQQPFPPSEEDEEDPDLLYLPDEEDDILKEIDQDISEETIEIPADLYENSDQVDPFAEFDKRKKTKGDTKLPRKKTEGDTVELLSSPIEIKKPFNFSSAPTKIRSIKKLEEEESYEIAFDPRPNSQQNTRQIRRVDMEEETKIVEKPLKESTSTDRLGQPSKTILDILETPEDGLAFTARSAALEAGLKWALEPMESIDDIHVKNNETRWLNITNPKASITIVQKNLNETRDPTRAIEKLYESFVKNLTRASSDNCEVSLKKEHRAEFEGKKNMSLAKFLEFHIIPKLWALKNITEHANRSFKSATLEMKKKLEEKDVENNHFRKIPQIFMDTIKTSERKNGIINLSEKEMEAMGTFFNSYLQDDERIDSALERLSRERDFKLRTTSGIISNSNAIKNILKTAMEEPQMYNMEIEEVGRILEEVPAMKNKEVYDSVLDEIVNSENSIIEIQKTIMHSFGLLIQRLLAESLQSKRRSIETQNKIKLLGEKKVEWEDIKTIYLYKFLDLTEDEIGHLEKVFKQEIEPDKKSRFLEKMIFSEKNHEAFCDCVKFVMRIDKSIFNRQKKSDFIGYEPKPELATRIGMTKENINSKLLLIITNESGSPVQRLKELPRPEVPNLEKKLIVRTTTHPLTKNENSQQLDERIGEAFEEALRKTAEETIKKLREE